MVYLNISWANMTENDSFATFVYISNSVRYAFKHVAMPTECEVVLSLDSDLPDKYTEWPAGRLLWTTTTGAMEYRGASRNEYALFPELLKWITLPSPWPVTDAGQTTDRAGPHILSPDVRYESEQGGGGGRATTDRAIVVAVAPLLCI